MFFPIHKARKSRSAGPNRLTPMLRVTKIMCAETAIKCLGLMFATH